MLCSSTVLDARFPGSYARFEGVSSSAGAHGWNINEQVCPGCSGSVSTPLLGLESRSGRLSGGNRLAHCWVLRQQDLLFLVFLRMPETGREPSLAGGGGWWMGVTGLLFENYIVDASILKIIKCNFR